MAADDVKEVLEGDRKRNQIRRRTTDLEELCEKEGVWPVELPGVLKLSEVPKFRKLHCVLYDDCLNAVAVAGWRGWSCIGCPRAGLEQNVLATCETLTHADNHPYSPHGMWIDEEVERQDEAELEKEYH